MRGSYSWYSTFASSLLQVNLFPFSTTSDFLDLKDRCFFNVGVGGSNSVTLTLLLYRMVSAL